MAPSTDSTDMYPLLRNAAATTRLTAQHYLWSQTLGYTIHPDIPTLRSNAKVIDVATGAGQWLFDVSRQSPPSIQLDGSDVSLDQCPPKAWLPSNVSLVEWNFYEDPPASLVGQYDLVHVRLVNLAIQDSNPGPVIANLVKLLKPGGYIQWGEVMNAQCHVVKADPSVSTPNLEELQAWMVTPKKGLPSDSWKWELPDLMNKAGFQNSVLHDYVGKYSIDRTLIKNYTDSYFILCEEFVGAVFHPEDEEAIKHRARIAAAMQEAKAGAGIVFPQVVCIAQKAT